MLEQSLKPSTSPSSLKESWPRAKSECKGGGGLDLAPLEGPAAKEMIIERGPSGEVTSILVNYPTASMIVNFPLTRSGASLIELVEPIDVVWDR